MLWKSLLNSRYLGLKYWTNNIKDKLQIKSRIMSAKKFKAGSKICDLVAQHRRDCSANITEFLSSSKGVSLR